MSMFGKLYFWKAANYIETNLKTFVAINMSRDQFDDAKWPTDM